MGIQPEENRGKGKSDLVGKEPGPGSFREEMLEDEGMKLWKDRGEEDGARSLKTQ